MLNAFDEATFHTFTLLPQREYFAELFSKGQFRKQHIVAAACRSQDKQIMLVSSRHWDLAMNRQADVLGLRKVMWPVSEQGFIDQYGNYIDRVTAAKIVIKNEQPLRMPLESDRLYSENLY